MSPYEVMGAVGLTAVVVSLIWAKVTMRLIGAIEDFTETLGEIKGCVQTLAGLKKGE